MAIYWKVKTAPPRVPLAYLKTQKNISRHRSSLSLYFQPAHINTENSKVHERLRMIRAVKIASLLRQSSALILSRCLVFYHQRYSFKINEAASINSDFILIGQYQTSARTIGIHIIRYAR